MGPFILAVSCIPLFGHARNLPAAILGIIFITFACQAVERLYWPIRAAKRTAGLSEHARTALEAAKIGLPVLGLVLVGVGMVRGSHSSLTALGWGLWLSGHFFADVLGQRLFSPQFPGTSQGFHSSQSFQTLNLKPIHSEHWGER